MIDSDKQRRWWFANHPEYSNSHKGKGNKHDNDGRSDQERVSPEGVDAYVDEALKYLDGPEAELLKSIKRNFGTEAEKKKQSNGPGLNNAEQAAHDRQGTSQFRKYSDEQLRRMGIPTPEEEALVSDPHTFLDIAPYGRFITSPVQSLKSLLRSKALDAILYWKKGDDIYDLTTKGRVPAWSTVAQRYWKNSSLEEVATDKWGSENVRRMTTGRAPQQVNRKTGELESRELHHHPVPRSKGGREFIEVWPEEHAAIDPHRRLKKR